MREINPDLRERYLAWCEENHDDPAGLIEELIEQIISTERPTEYEANVKAINANTAALSAPRFTMNAYWNTSRVRQIWIETNECRDIRRLPTGKGKPALICGSGPSLLDWRGRLDKRLTIFTGASNHGFFAEEGRDPEYTVILDDNPEMGQRLMQYEHQIETDVITHPAIDPQVLTYPRLWFMLYQPDDIHAAYGMQHVYKMIAGQPGIISRVSAGGNYVNCAMVIAQTLGYSPIYLAGYDLAYIDGMLRWDMAGDVPKDAIEVDGLPAAVNMSIYAQSAMITIEKYGINAISASRGLLTELPYMTPHDIGRALPA